MTPQYYRHAAKYLSLSQARAARLFGVRLDTVRRWTSGEIPAPDFVVERLENALRVQGYLKEARALPLSPDWTAKVFGVTPGTVRRWASGETPVPHAMMERLHNAALVQRYRAAAADLAMSPSLAAKIFRAHPRTVRRWLSSETPIPHWVAHAAEEMVEWQIEPIEWRRAQDKGICTSTGGRWLRSPSSADLAEKGLERDVVNGLWVIQPLGTRAARWDAPAARRKP